MVDKLPPEEYPLYDPDEHTDPDTVVRVECYCGCGAVSRAVGRVEQMAGWEAEFSRRHWDNDDPNCRNVSEADALRTRESKRKAAHILAGLPEDEYTPKYTTASSRRRKD